MSARLVAGSPSLSDRQPGRPDDGAGGRLQVQGEADLRGGRHQGHQEVCQNMLGGKGSEEKEGGGGAGLSHGWRR